MDRGPLLRVKVGDNHFVKMHEQDAIERGYLPGKPKARAQAENKMQPAPVNKADDASPTGKPIPDADDLTTIEGIGLGVARSLAARGITTFAALKSADDVSYLSKKAQKAVADWKNG